MTNKTLPPQDLDLKDAIAAERELFAKVEVPIVTISSTYRKELADQYDILAHYGGDVVFSRAHYSMAEGVRQAAKELGKTTQMTDPTNYVSERDWGKVELTQKVGQLMARYGILKWIKDKIDTIARDKLPIANAITSPLFYLTENTQNPIISLHYESGNQLFGMKKKVVQVVTDPHVRPQYLYSLPNDSVIFCVFDEDTKKEFFKAAKKLERKVNDGQVVVTGPPVDPRIARMGAKKEILRGDRPLRLAVCTGGLGTNLKEIKEVLKQLSPLLKPREKIQLFLYAGTHRDFRDFFEDYAREHHIRVGNLDETKANIRILYDDSIIDANKNLIKYMFPWADGVITKPSGDMAYDAASAGCFMLFLEPWGTWEANIRKIFTALKVGWELDVPKVHEQFTSLWEKGEFNNAMENAKNLPGLFRKGAENIVKTQQNLQAS